MLKVGSNFYKIYGDHENNTVMCPVCPVCPLTVTLSPNCHFDTKDLEKVSGEERKRKLKNFLKKVHSNGLKTN